MIGYCRSFVIRRVHGAYTRGNPLARRLVAWQTRRFYASLPTQSSIVTGEVMIPDPERPLPEEFQGGMMGDHEMMPLDPRPVTADRLIGRQVETVSGAVGSYGMGGYGFFGLCLGAEWFIVPIGDAGTWIELDGRIVEDPMVADDAAVKPWIENADESALLVRLEGARITDASLRRQGLTLDFDNGARLHVDERPDKRPVFAGNGKHRAFLPDDDLAAALFFSPTPLVFV